MLIFLPSSRGQPDAHLSERTGQSGWGRVTNGFSSKWWNYVSQSLVDLRPFGEGDHGGRIKGHDREHSRPQPQAHKGRFTTAETAQILGENTAKEVEIYKQTIYGT
jgi:hypothetical protein